MRIDFEENTFRDQNKLSDRTKPFPPLILTFILRPINIPVEERFVVNLWTASQKSISGINKLMNILTTLLGFVILVNSYFTYFIILF